MFNLRRILSNDECTLGVLTHADDLLCCTLELPFLNNRPNLSSIPIGAYRVKKNYSKKFGWCYRLLNVPNRSDILIHVGNTPLDTRGCILVGTGFADNALIQSQSALSKLLVRLPSEFQLYIS